MLPRLGLTVGCLGALLAGCGDALLTESTSTASDPFEFSHALEAAPWAGRLRVTWAPYEAADFEEYRLHTVGNGEPVLRYTTSDPTAASWVDSTFIGGTETYALEVVRTDGSSLRATHTVQAAPAAITDVETTPAYRARVRWTPGDVGSNVDTYRIRRRTYGADGVSEELMLTETLDPADTDFVDLSSVFGGAGYAYQLISRQASSSEQASAYVAFQIGADGHLFEQFAYSPAHRSYYLLLPDYETMRLWRVDATSHEVVAKVQWSSQHVQYSFGLSANGAFLFAADGTSLVQLDPLTLEEIQRYSTISLIGYQAYPDRLAVSDEGLLFFSTWTYRSPTWSADGSYIVDLNTLEAQRIGRDDLYAEMQFAPGGDFAFFEQRGIQLFALRGTELLEPPAVPSLPARTSIAILDAQRYVVAGEERLSIREAKTGQELARYEIGHRLQDLVVDPETGYVGGYVAGRSWYEIIDASTGQRVDRVEVLAPHDGRYRLVNHTLFTSGHYLPLQRK